MKHHASWSNRVVCAQERLVQVVVVWVRVHLTEARANTRAYIGSRAASIQPSARTACATTVGRGRPQHFRCRYR
jgi:hypothetical protein